MGEKKSSSKIGRRKKTQTHRGPFFISSQFPVSPPERERAILFFFFIAVPLRDFSFPDQILDWRSNTLFMCTKRGNGNECKVLSFLSRLNSRCPWMARAIKICQYKERKKQCDAENGQVYWKRRQSPIQPRTYISWLNS